MDMGVRQRKRLHRTGTISTHGLSPDKANSMVTTNPACQADIKKTPHITFCSRFAGILFHNSSTVASKPRPQYTLRLPPLPELPKAMERNYTPRSQSTESENVLKEEIQFQELKKMAKPWYVSTSKPIFDL